MPFFDRVMFTPTAGGLGSFVVSLAVTGYRTPAQAGIPNGTVVSYVAESLDKSQWEVGQGVYTSATTTLARTTLRESSTGSFVNFTLPPRVWIDYVASNIVELYVKDFGAIGDGVIDDIAAIQNAINFASALGGGTVYLTASTYKINSTLSLPSKVRLVSTARGAAIIKWGGAVSSDILLTPSQTVDCAIENLVVDANNIADCTGFHLVDTQRSRFDNLAFLNTGAASPSGTAVRLQAGAGGNGSAFNNVFNIFNQIKTNLWATGLQMDGTTTAVVTLNTLTQLDIEDYSAGIIFSQWADNNSFYHVRLESDRSNTFGVIYNNSVTPAVDVGVYANNFYGLAIDAFGGGVSGVSGLFFNVTKMNLILGYFIGTTPFPGAAINDNFGRSQSHYIHILNEPLGVSPTSQIVSKGVVAITSPSPITLTGTSGAVGPAAQSVIVNASGTFTLTTPVSPFAGQWLYVKNITAQIVNSAAANIVPIGTAVAGTAILTATAGKWASLQFDGTNWVTMAAN